MAQTSRGAGTGERSSFSAPLSTSLSPSPPLPPLQTCLLLPALDFSLAPAPPSTSGFAHSSPAPRLPPFPFHHLLLSTSPPLICLLVFPSPRLASLLPSFAFSLFPSPLHSPNSLSFTRVLPSTCSTLIYLLPLPPLLPTCPLRSHIFSLSRI